MSTSGLEIEIHLLVLQSIERRLESNMTAVWMLKIRYPSGEPSLQQLLSWRHRHCALELCFRIHVFGYYAYTCFNCGPSY